MHNWKRFITGKDYRRYEPIAALNNLDATESYNNYSWDFPVPAGSIWYGNLPGIRHAYHLDRNGHASLFLLAVQERGKV